jgi:hypothetical protein
MIEVHLGYGLEELGGRPDDLTCLLDGYRFEPLPETLQTAVGTKDRS